MVMHLRNIVQLKKRKENLPMVRVHNFDEKKKKLMKVERDKVKLPPITNKKLKQANTSTNSNHSTSSPSNREIAASGYTKAQIEYIRNLSKAKKVQRARREDYVGEIYFTKKRKKLSRIVSKANVWSQWGGY